MCYLPDTNEGHEVLDLLREAFNRRLVFTVGDSVTSGQQNVVTVCFYLNPTLLFLFSGMAFITKQIRMEELRTTAIPTHNIWIV